jgi:hypothetical protein
MPRARPPHEIERVASLTALGLTDAAVSAVTNVPVNTIRAWRRRARQRTGRPSGEDVAAQCPHCGEPPHDFGGLPVNQYAYLLGVYLGDGHIVRNHTSWTLRIVLDGAYPGIIDEIQGAVHVVSGRRPSARPSRRDASVVVATTERSWPCLFPQHGPGRKHARPIVLTEWQQAIVKQGPGRFLRGLIHTDGWRGLNRVRSKGKDYQYPRYQFSNRSDDIRRLFTDTCDFLGIDWRQWTRYHISVARRDSVAALDRFVGPKL